MAIHPFFSFYAFCAVREYIFLWIHNIFLFLKGNIIMRISSILMWSKSRLYSNFLLENYHSGNKVVTTFLKMQWFINWKSYMFQLGFFPYPDMCPLNGSASLDWVCFQISFHLEKNMSKIRWLYPQHQQSICSILGEEKVGNILL